VGRAVSMIVRLVLIALLMVSFAREHTTGYGGWPTDEQTISKRGQGL